MGYFKDLTVWQDSMVLISKVYKLTNKGRLSKDFGLRNQMQRSAVSIASNIAEGEERKSDKESIRYFNIANGSISELITQITIASNIGYIDNETAIALEQEAEIINASLKNLIKFRSKSL